MSWNILETHHIDERNKNRILCSFKVGDKIMARGMYDGFVWGIITTVEKPPYSSWWGCWRYILKNAYNHNRFVDNTVDESSDIVIPYDSIKACEIRKSITYIKEHQQLIKEHSNYINTLFPLK